MVKTSGHFIFYITYLLICFIISIPFNYATYQLLFPSDGIPAGWDVAHHTYSILKILETGNPLVVYSQFPSNPTDQNYTEYYPSFFHLTISALTRLASLNQASAAVPDLVIAVETSFMFGASLAGTAGYAIVIRRLVYSSIARKINTNSELFSANLQYRLLHLIVSILAFSFFIFSVTSIVQLYNDGTHGEIFAMWLIFPYYLYLLINRHWILSGILLSVIASSHNLSILMSLSATLSYLISLVLQEFRSVWKGLIKFLATFLICSIPAFIFFYVSPVTSLLTEGVTESAPPGLSEPYPLTRVIDQLKPGLLYGGIVCMLLLCILNYRDLAWLSGWVGLYFVVMGLSSLLGERFARELSVTFGIVIGTCAAHVLFLSYVAGRQWFKLFRSMVLKHTQINSLKLIIAVVVCAIAIPLWYLYFHDTFQHLSNPLIVKYFTDTIDESNKYLLKTTDQKQNNGTIIMFGANPWLKVTTFGKLEVLELQPSELASRAGTGTSGGDRAINHELNEIFRSPYVASAACVLKKYGVDFVDVAMHNLPERYYYMGHNSHLRQLGAFQSFSSPLLKLEEEFIGRNQEYIRIYSVNQDSVNKVCKSE